MSYFIDAIDTVLKHEGFISNNSSDPGGFTKYGISLRFMKSTGAVDTDGDGYMDGDLDQDGDIDSDDIRLLTKDAAIDIYKTQFWDRYGYDRIWERQLAVKVFDLSVNMGPAAAHRAIQRALRAAEHRVAVDGILGPISITKINLISSFGLLTALRSEAASYYRQINYKGSEKFIVGWLNRAYA